MKSGFVTRQTRSGVIVIQKERERDIEHKKEPPAPGHPSPDELVA